MPKIAEVNLSSCGLRKKLRLRNCGATLLKKLRNCDCGSASFKLQNCDCGPKRKLRMPTSAPKYEKAFATHLAPSYWIQSITRNAPQASLHMCACPNCCQVNKSLQHKLLCDDVCYPWPHQMTWLSAGTPLPTSYRWFFQSFSLILYN
jgi:hypothetical protein